MTIPDISPEAVTRLASHLDENEMPNAAATLRALREALTAAEVRVTEFEAEREPFSAPDGTIWHRHSGFWAWKTAHALKAAEARAEAAERALAEQEVGGYVLIPRDALRGTSLDCIFKDERLALCRKKLAMNEIMILIDLVQSAKAHKAEARAEAAEKALRPFAKAGELFVVRGEFNECVYAPAAGPEYNITGDDLRRARAAIGGKP